MTYFQHEAYKWNPQEDQEIIEGIEKIYYENCDPSLFELEVRPAVAAMHGPHSLVRFGD